MMNARADCHEPRCINKPATRSRGHDVVPSAAGLSEKGERIGANPIKDRDVGSPATSCCWDSRCSLLICRSPRFDSGNNHGVTSVFKTTLKVTKIPMLPETASPIRGHSLNPMDHTFGKDGDQLIFGA